MIKSPEHDYIQRYEQATRALKKQPSDLDLKHQAVLSLAQTGALDFAIAEYARYELDKVQGHEDIMALAGRLSKDLYLKAHRNCKNDSKTTIEHARDAAHKYEAAFQSTRGFYSGINAATMAYMADMPGEIISERIDAILNILPDSQALSPTDHYFVEATRAECLLLKGEIGRAKNFLKSATTFDPLNYTAHASTLRQFKMILSKSGGADGWLKDFTPPKSIHFAGHIELGTAEKDLSLMIIDHIQRHDIGFGFGALAAGSDILIAEALLEEGAELHVILPCPVKTFEALSVKPFGGEWTARYKTCLKSAASVKVLSETAPWPDAIINRTAGQFAMGQAIMHSQAFSRHPAQLLIWDGKKRGSFTALHAKDWKQGDREQIIINSESATASKSKARSRTKPFQYSLMRSDTMERQSYAKADEAIKAAANIFTQSPDLKLALHLDLPNEDTDAILQNIIQAGPAHIVLMSELAASLVTQNIAGPLNINYAGLIALDQLKTLRCYALSL